MTDKSIASIANISEQDLLSFTPAMRQFIQIKRDNPTLLIMYRMGDFYETFFEDAELVHKVLGLTLTSRSSTNSGTRIPMAGIPYMTLISIWFVWSIKASASASASSSALRAKA